MSISRLPDHTTLSRRGQDLGVKFHLAPANEPIHLIVDSSGLSIAGEGEGAAVKHGGRGTRGWKKLHLGVDGSGAIVAHVLTDGNADDATTALKLIAAVDGDISGFTTDGAYDTIAVYEAAGEHSRSPDHEDKGGRTPPVERGVGLPAAGPRGERLLQAQVDHRRPASRSPREGTGS